MSVRVLRLGAKLRAQLQAVISVFCVADVSMERRDFLLDYSDRHLTAR